MDITMEYYVEKLLKKEKELREIATKLQKHKREERYYVVDKETRNKILYDIDRDLQEIKPIVSRLRKELGDSYELSWLNTSLNSLDFIVHFKLLSKVEPSEFLKNARVLQANVESIRLIAEKIESNKS